MGAARGSGWVFSSGAHRSLGIVNAPNGAGAGIPCESTPIDRCPYRHAWLEASQFDL